MDPKEHAVGVATFTVFGVADLDLNCLFCQKGECDRTVRGYGDATCYVWGAHEACLGLHGKVRSNWELEEGASA